MTPTTRTALNRLSFIDLELDDCQKVKQHFLKEYRLSPGDQSLVMMKNLTLLYFSYM